MMGECSAQGDLFRGDHLHLDYVGRETLYGWLGAEGPRVYPDGDFKDFYVLDNGRKSVPPSQMMRMVLLQWYDKVSDEEAILRAKFDLRWKAALGLEDHEGLCAKATLQTFRGKLLLSGKGREILKQSVKVCREAGVLRSRKVRGGGDTSPIIGRGAVKDTYNLVADGMVKLLRALAAFETPVVAAVDVVGFARAHDLSRYVTGGSLKGGAALDWEDESARVAFLTGLVVDVRRALALAQTLLDGADGAQAGMRCGTAEDVQDAMALLARLVAQDIEVCEDGQAHIKPGGAKDRVPSVHDPEMRHGRKSKRTRFDGHKGEVVVDTDSGTILDVSVKPGNAHDADGSLAAIERAEETVQEAWEDAGDEEDSEAQCLAPSTNDDVPGAKPRGRSISEHPEEELLAKARALQRTREFRAAYRERQTVEHRLARMMQLGARHARYFGRAKTELQWLLAAAVANLTLALGYGGEKRAQKTSPACRQGLLPRIAGKITRATALLLPLPFGSRPTVAPA